MYYYAIGTYRYDHCHKNSGIKGLVLDRKYGNGEVHSIENLKILADAGLLRTHPSCSNGSAQIRIFWSRYYNRYIATTRADDVECNNLLSLKIYYPSGLTNGNNIFSQCSI